MTTPKATPKFVVIETSKLRPERAYYADGSQRFCEEYLRDFAGREDFAAIPLRGLPRGTHVLVAAYTLVERNGQAVMVEHVTVNPSAPAPRERYAIVERATMFIGRPYLDAGFGMSVPMLQEALGALNHNVQPQHWPASPDRLGPPFLWDPSNVATHYIIDTHSGMSGMRITPTTGTNNIAFGAAAKVTSPTDAEIVAAWLATQRWLEGPRDRPNPHGHEWDDRGRLCAIFVGPERNQRVLIETCRQAWSRELQRRIEAQARARQLICQGTFPDDL